jgi:hypothetical protein
MKGGSQSRHKRTKMRMLPGDVPKSEKINMLEGNIDALYERNAHTAMLDVNQAKRAKGYKKDFVKKANRRARRASPTTDGLDD